MELRELRQVSWPRRHHRWVSLFHCTSSASVLIFYECSWTRGMGLMLATNVFAQHVECRSLRTYSAKEMAFNILGQHHTGRAYPGHLNGGVDHPPDLADITVRSHQDINAVSSLREAISCDNALVYKITNGPDAEAVLRNVPMMPHANFKLEFPKPELPESLADLTHLQGLTDLEKVIAIAGLAEAGLWGSSQTRWEMEARGRLTIEGCFEMARIMASSNISMANSRTAHCALGG